MIDLLNFSWYYWMILTPLPESGNMKLEWTWRTWPMAARQLFWLNDLCIAASLVVDLGPLWWCCDDTVVILWWYFIELDDGKILTGKPNQFDGKNPWVSGFDFPFNQSIEILWSMEVQTIFVPNDYRSGKQPHNYGKSPCYQWENPLFQWVIFNSQLLT